MNGLADRSSRPLLLVSSDSHAGPSLERELRQYCPKKYLLEFDDFARQARDEGSFTNQMLLADQQDPYKRDAYERTISCPGQHDPDARLRDMDREGIAAEIIFAGGQNNELLPFVGIGWDAGAIGTPRELREVGEHIWNEWLAGFVSPSPQRLLGVMQVPIWEIAGAVRELEWGRNRGLRVVNLPAPRSDLVAYNDPVYEPFWSACVDLDMVLVTHGGGGERPMGFPGVGGKHILMVEVGWLSRRHLWQMIFGGVFHRHPQLKLVFTEQRVAWVGPTLAELDSIYYSEEWARDLRVELPRSPSEYWASNCFNSGSFLAPWEAALRGEVGLANLLWGSDYPHHEGTWPTTLLALRYTFAGISEQETRMILGENALSAYGLEADGLRPIADRIGPTHEEVQKPIESHEWPAYRSSAFRFAGQNSV